MKTMKTKLVLSAIGIALLASPAFAQRVHQYRPHAPVVGTYPNPTVHTGSQDSVDSGAAFNQDRGY